MTATLLARSSNKKSNCKSRALQPRASGFVARRASLPEYLEHSQIETLIELAPNGQSRLIMLAQWRAGLRISEVLALEVADLNLDDDNPALRVREGKGGKGRLFPLHPELIAGLRARLDYGNINRGPIFHASRSTAGRCVRIAFVPGCTA